MIKLTLNMLICKLTILIIINFGEKKSDVYIYIYIYIVYLTAKKKAKKFFS